MLLYALYTPKEESSWNRPRVYAFASVERFIVGSKLINDVRPRAGKLTLITREEALKVSSLARRFISTAKRGVPDDSGELIHIVEDAVRSTWDGKMQKIPLVDLISDELVFCNMVYP